MVKFTTWNTLTISILALPGFCPTFDIKGRHTEGSRGWKTAQESRQDVGYPNRQYLRNNGTCSEKCFCSYRISSSTKNSSFRTSFRWLHLTLVIFDAILAEIKVSSTDTKAIERPAWKSSTQVLNQAVEVVAQPLFACKLELFWFERKLRTGLVSKKISRNLLPSEAVWLESLWSGNICWISSHSGLKRKAPIGRGEATCAFENWG